MSLLTTMFWQWKGGTSAATKSAFRVVKSAKMSIILVFHLSGFHSYRMFHWSSFFQKFTMSD